ncbi:hypothetical protein EDC30_107120 [Paucimonas lemoignei]|uniref:Uncharacterized protein n=1 Tax=Paucimonas lemoignei TaxID=29443 RepID=A0A4R3HUX9_PAULE|nr:hypothetical protein [Paucimonas lemoignei]TCS36303.1 hypothetical protein EDC30_107120 [Paucimonas lemoignei]
MKNECQYFSDCDEWSNLEREFANRVVQAIGMSRWHDLLTVQRLHGKDAFLREIGQIWPDGTPPGG